MSSNKRERSNSSDEEEDGFGDGTTVAESGSVLDITGVFTYAGGWIDITQEMKQLIEVIIIEEGVTEIPDRDGNRSDVSMFGLFHGCIRLISISIPDSCVKIGSFALGDCRSLKTIRLPDTLVMLSEHALAGCSSLKTLTIPETCLELSASCLAGCSALANLKIPDSCRLQLDHRSALMDCTALQALAERFNLNVEQYCRRKWRTSKVFAFKLNLFACYNVLDRLRINDPLLNDPIIDKKSILWVMYERITSDDVRRKIMEYLDYEVMSDDYFNSVDDDGILYVVNRRTMMARHYHESADETMIRVEFI